MGAALCRQCAGCTGTRPGPPEHCRAHNVHCVTVAARAGPKRGGEVMRGPGWHECCSCINHQRHSREGNNAEGYRRTARVRKRSEWLDGHCARPHNNEKNSSTHKQATDTPPQAGFFLPGRLAKASRKPSTARGGWLDRRRNPACIASGSSVRWVAKKEATGWLPRGRYADLSVRVGCRNEDAGLTHISNRHNSGTSCSRPS